MAKTRISFGVLVKDVKRRINDNSVLDYGATLAFFWFLAIFPGLIFALALLSFFNFDQDYLQQQLDALGPGSVVTGFLGGILNAISEPQGGLLSFGAILAIWSASSGVIRLVTLTVNAYGQKEKRNFIVKRLLGIALTAALGIGMILLIVSNVFGSQIIRWVSEYIPISGAQSIMINVFRYTLATFILIIALAMFYKFAPQMKIRWRDTLPGAIFGVIAWQLASFGFSVYVSNFANYNQTYGSLGGIIVTLLWLYLTGVIILIGSEINASWQFKGQNPLEEDNYDDIPTNIY